MLHNQGNLTYYEVASGQKINCEKSSIFFSTNTPSSTRDEIRMLLNTKSTEPFEKYVALPPIIGRGKKQAFAESNFVFNPNSVGGKLNHYLR